MSETPKDRESYASLEVATGSLALYATLLVAGVAITIVAAWLAVSVMSPSEGSVDALADSRAGPSGPFLQADPARELAEHLARERALLESYAWVDREQGRVRIPVERALELLLEEGFPTREAGDATPEAQR